MSSYKSFAITVTGGSHSKQGKVCQDASYKIDNDSLAIAVVADGHGDDNYFRSDKGAKLAVACAVKGIVDFITIHEPKFNSGIFRKKDAPTKDEFEKLIRELVKHIIASWQIKVEEDYIANPFTKDELDATDEKHRKRYENGKELNKVYGTTLLATAITDEYWFGIHIGDGKLTALYADGSYEQPIPWDEKCYLNVTTSICDDDAIDKARIYFSFNNEKKPPVVTFICTDGIDDNYPVDGNEKHLFKIYRTIALTFAKEGFDSTYNQLIELATAFATKGKGDDTSIGGFINIGNLKKVEHIWQQQIDDEEKVEKKKVEKEVKKTSNEAEHEKDNNLTPTQRAIEAITQYEKNNGISKYDVTLYGDFTAGKQNK